MQFCEPRHWYGGPATERCWNIMVAMHKHKGGDLQIGKLLPELLMNAGFVGIVGKDCPVKLHGSSQDEAEARSASIGILQAMKTAVLANGGFGLVSSEKEYEGLIIAAEREWTETPGATKGFTVVYAQKPTDGIV